MKDQQMQKILNRQPVFRWQQHSNDHFLFCGAVFIAELRFRGRINGDEHYRIDHAAFLDALSVAGEGRWNGQPLDLKGATFAEVADMVEEFYTAVFDKLDFTDACIV